MFKYIVLYFFVSFFCIAVDEDCMKFRKESSLFFRLLNLLPKGVHAVVLVLTKFSCRLDEMYLIDF